MINQQDDGEERGVAPQDPRRERLKQALRENLKRRKFQVRERGKLTAAPSTGHEPAIDDKAGGEGE